MNAWNERALSFLLNGLWRASWQASVLAIVVLAVQKMLGARLGGKGRYALWAVVLVRLLLPALPESRVSIFNLGRVVAHRDVTNATRTETTVAPAQTDSIPIIVVGSTNAKLQAVGEVVSVHAADIGTTRSSRKISWATWAFAAWVAGILILGTRVARACVALSRTMRSLAIVEDETLLATLQSCARTLGLRKLPQVLSGDAAQTPAVVGLFRPKLLLPAHVIERCDAREIRLIVMHELAHLKRRDIAGNWLIAAATIVHWFNPIVWLAAARMRSDRELACDELVLAHCDGESQTYGKTLVKLIELLSLRATPRQLVGILESTTPIQRRVRMIAQFNPGQSHRWIWTLVALLVLASVALTDAVHGDSQAKPNATTPTTAPSDQKTAEATVIDAYDVSDLIQQIPNQPPDKWSDPLVHVIEGFVAPESWKDNGGEVGSIEVLNSKLVVQQTPDAHKKIADLLELLRAQRPASAAAPIEVSAPSMTFGPGGPPGAVAPGPQPASARSVVSDADIEAANSKALDVLKKKLPEVKFDSTPLSDVIDFYRDTTGANIFVNWKALEVAGIDRNAPVSLRLKDTSFETVLRSTLRQAGDQILAIVIDRGVITITTQMDLPSYNITKTYDVKDLIDQPADINSLSAVMQGLTQTQEGGLMVQTFGTKLIITALPSAHEQVEKLLADLRNKPATQPSK